MTVDIFVIENFKEIIIVAWLLTSKNILSWPLTFILTADEDRSTQHNYVSAIPLYLSAAQ